MTLVTLGSSLLHNAHDTSDWQSLGSSEMASVLAGSYPAEVRQSPHDPRPTQTFMLI